MKIKESKLRNLIKEELKRQLNESKSFVISKTDSSLFISPTSGMLNPIVYNKVIDIIKDELRVKDINDREMDSIEIETLKSISVSDLASIVSMINKELNLDTKRQNKNKFIVG